jgi:chorismate dehydratase
MNPQSLFQKKDSPEESNNLRSICCGSELDDRVLIYGLADSFDVKLAPAHVRFEWINGGGVDIGFISAIDFAYLKGGWKIFPDICKSSFGPSKRSLLFFNKHLNKIEKIAVSPGTRTSQTALNIILRERYQMNCEYVKAADKLDILLEKYDAVLLTGDIALYNSINRSNYLDISEEWRDMTGLPLVYGFWIGNELLELKNANLALKTSVVKGENNYSAIAKKQQPQIDLQLKINYLREAISFELSEEQKAGLNELYRYAFFYGITKYIPDLNFIDDKK